MGREGGKRKGVCLSRVPLPFIEASLLLISTHTTDTATHSRSRPLHLVPPGGRKHRGGQGSEAWMRKAMPRRSALLQQLGSRAFPAHAANWRHPLDTEGKTCKHPRHSCFLRTRGQEPFTGEGEERCHPTGVWLKD